MFSWDSCRKTRRHRIRRSSNVNERWVSVSHAVLEMTALLMRTFSCATYLPLSDLSLKLNIFKGKQNQTKLQTNKHENYHQETLNNLNTAEASVTFPQSVLWVHIWCKRRNSDKQITGCLENMNPVSKQFQFDGGSVFLRHPVFLNRPVEISTTPTVIPLEWDVQKHPGIEQGRNHQCRNAVWDISEANHTKPDLWGPPGPTPPRCWCKYKA